jgi:elongation factor G
VLLEPFVTLEITTPTQALGSIAADLSTRRGRIIETLSLPSDTALVRAEAPLAEVASYGNTLKSMTRGLGSFVMEFSHDDLAPASVQRQLAGEWKPRGGDDD